jgi:uncharacterized protein (TIGR02266 family)
MDTRSFPRIPVHLNVRYRTDADFQACFIDSLSGGGVFIRTSRPMPIGTEITMEIEIEGHEPVAVRGKVVWGRLVGRDDGMGVQFLDPPPDRLKKLLTSKVA